MLLEYGRCGGLRRLLKSRYRQGYTQTYLQVTE